MSQVQWSKYSDPSTVAQVQWPNGKNSGPNGKYSDQAQWSNTVVQVQWPKYSGQMARTVAQVASTVTEAQ